MRFVRDLSVSAASAGFVAVLVGYTSSVAIVFQAAQAFGADARMLASWMWALGLGMGLCTLLPSLWLRKPVMVAWSTPGAAMLAGAAASAQFDMAQAVGAFMLCALAISVAGFSGWFERIMGRIPQALAAALLAGVLTRFALAGFAAAQTALPLVLVMLVAYLLARRWWTRYAVVLTLGVAVVFVALDGSFKPVAHDFALAMPVFVAPQFSWAATVGLAVPLFIVTMASQNLPGVAAIEAAGYGRTAPDGGIPVSRIIGLTGVATLLLAPLGAFALNLSAITAAICMGPEAHPDPKRRYTAAAVCGLLYCLCGLFGAAIATLLSACPQALVVAIAALALLGTIAGALQTALSDASQREPALITFAVTLSGVTLAGVGSAFWGVVAGALAMGILGWGKKPGHGA